MANDINICNLNHNTVKPFFNGDLDGGRYREVALFRGEEGCNMKPDFRHFLYLIFYLTVAQKYLTQSEYINEAETRYVRYGSCFVIHSLIRSFIRHSLVLESPQRGVASYVYIFLTFYNKTWGLVNAICSWPLWREVTLRRDFGTRFSGRFRCEDVSVVERLI